MKNTRLSLRQARRTALAAQGLARVRPTGLVNARQVGRTFERLAVLQIDSVNVLSRSHYLPLFSRLGPYDSKILDRMAGRRPRRMVEYWAHEASFVRPELFADLRAVQRRTWMTAGSLPEVLAEDLRERILEVLESAGRPLTSRETMDLLGHSRARGTTDWGWNWNAAKRVLEDLFAAGLISSAGRTAQFERLYAPTQAVHPAGAAALAPSDFGDAVLRLTEAAARAHGVATVRGLADYFRLQQRETALAAEELAGKGILERVEVAGWRQPAYLHAEAVIPRAVSGQALLSPFDSLVFERRRLEELFGFHYRIEIYTPPEKRRFGYYVLPFLLGEELVARVDLKADRGAGMLLVQAAHSEPGAPHHTARQLAAELRLMAQWLGLGQITVKPAGDLAPALKLEVSRE
ncbi:crosslink repair DNA glycosylase YcaQ family protein [Arthrobacter sp. zg-Y877]|uniref:winged helix-turn-helix domain-containing protein n=1 Tax=Arthrobacter sp. zg-Y877 TaxID=3049074 RepID=UPI0025A35E2E|nr:crosslink repair DNA glycosylase YcaQ family protein [Arthrobacter sp. zg-Y877]MDM7989826.1 crosslink repair DNA glycosylase YcaQ family protein [Arthrobacter sp. zg-Y877]